MQGEPLLPDRLSFAGKMQDTCRSEQERSFGLDPVLLRWEGDLREEEVPAILLDIQVLPDLPEEARDPEESVQC